MTTWDLIIALFYHVDEQLHDLPKHPEAHLWPSEVVTLGGEHGDAGGYAATGISSTSRSMSGYQRLKRLCRKLPFRGKIRKSVVLENNNEHFTRLSAEGLSLFHALLSPRQEVMLGSCQEVGPGEPGSAAVQSVRPSAW
jgi:hypothetical protein